MGREPTRDRVESHFDRSAAAYDRGMGMIERQILGQHRTWATSHASGRVLELAVGTGLNLALYPAAVTSVIGVELSRQMLARAQARIDIEQLSNRSVRRGDVQRLDLPDDSVDTVVSTYTLCTIPDPAQALAEAWRVLSPGGALVLLEHGPSANRLARAGQRLINPLAVRLAADSLLRDPVELARAAGFDVLAADRAGWAAVVYRVLARKPVPDTAGPASGTPPAGGG